MEKECNMRVHLDCIPCFVRQTLDTARYLNLEEDVTQRLLRRILDLVSQLDWTLPPPVIGRDIHRAIRKMTDEPDPFWQVKATQIEQALTLLPYAETAIAESANPFESAVLFSIAGNIVDLGAKTEVEADVEGAFKSALSMSVDPGSLQQLQEAIAEANNVLFLADNAGEIVFDTPLLEFIGSEKVVVAVRGSPVINDVTIDDASQAGIVEKFIVISNGSDTPGTFLSDCSEGFVKQFESADLIISKGQGNYEALSQEDAPLFFLFLTKCPTISKKLGLPINTCVIHRRKKNRLER